MTRKPVFIFTILFLLLGSACSGNRGNTPGTDASATASCIQNFDPVQDYFPQKTEIEYARNFSVQYHKYYKVATIHEASEGGSSERYVLLQCGAPTPELAGDLATATIITVPIASLFSGSPTHHPLLFELDRVDVLTGVDRLANATSQPVIDWINAGHVVEYAPGGVPNVERVIQSSPSMLMVSGTDRQEYAMIRNAGIGVVSNAEWLEQTALGRAEWIKYMALFLNEEGKAQERFLEIRNMYQDLVALTSRIPERERPLVMTGRVFRGMYSASGGRSYVADLINDAGGNYVWSDNEETGSAMIDLEATIQRAAEAQFWLNGNAWANRAAMLADEPRYTEFKAFRTGQVWMFDRKANKDGINDYWSKGVIRPDIILADMIKIFHPGLVPDHEFEWYRQIPD